MTTAATTTRDTSTWRYEFRPGEKYPDLGIYTILAPNPDVGNQDVAYAGKEIALADTDDQEIAEQIITEHNNHAKLVTALRNLVAADNCNYTVEGMRHQGYFDAAREALRLAGEPCEPYETPETGPYCQRHEVYHGLEASKGMTCWQ